jgi:hypothetical protein
MLTHLSEKSGTALWTCPSTAKSRPNYVVEFCPAGSDYVGPSTPNSKYISATASCEGSATTFISPSSQTFSVGPSPTKTQTIGTLQVIETVAPGIDGAAAFGLGGGAASSSVADMSTQPSFWHDTVSYTVTQVSTVIAMTSRSATAVTQTQTVTSGGNTVVVQLEEEGGGSKTVTVTAGTGSTGGIAAIAQPSTSATPSHCKKKGGQWLHGQRQGEHKRRGRRLNIL